MTLLYPWVIALIPLALWLIRRRRDRSSVTVPSLSLWPEKESGKARYLWIPIALRRLAIICILVALARPQWTSQHSLDISEGIAIQMLIDVSSSMDMDVQDFAGEQSSRMEVAKTMVSNFIAGDGDTLTGRPNDLIGLITFARYADTRSPLTFGHDALVQIVKNLQIQERPNEDGTAYGDALALAAARLKKLDELKHGDFRTDIDSVQSRVIILLTDGENNSGAHLPTEAAGLAKEWDCKIYAISLGDSNFAPTNAAGQETLTAAEQVLDHISKETGGIFRKASDYESLLSVYAEIDKLERAEFSTRSYDIQSECFWLPLSVALASLLVALSLEATILRVVP
ncbi:VWA domain-containing protein [Rubritalea spongiae]|uniref:VWA domain-containing protein n=1 Tax=Rubritalea spongiae TaxID=430797 RepID=A0ABW5E131_9BACT